MKKFNRKIWVVLMMIPMALVFLVVQTFAAWDDWHTGYATYTGSGYSGGAALLDPIPSDMEITALNPTQYNYNGVNAALAGAYLEVYGPNGNSTVVYVTDLYPEGADGALDLCPTSFAKIGDMSAGRIDIRWHVVKGPVSGNFSYRIKEGSSPYWAAMQVRNHKYPVMKMEYYKDGSWIDMVKQSYNHFLAENMGPNSIQVRITDIRGMAVTDTIPPLPANGDSAAYIVQGNVQCPDGSGPTPTPTPTTGSRSAFTQIEAESFNTQSGIQTESCAEGGQNIGYIENGDYVVYNNIDFGGGVSGFQARVASATSGGSIEIRLDGVTGALVGTCSVAGTGGWQNWVTKSCTVSGASGIHSLYLKFTGGSGFLFNVNWWKFSGGGPEPGVTYKIVNKNSGKLLDVEACSTADGANVHQWSDWGGANQQWKLEDAGSGYYYIINVNSGKVLGVDSFSTDDGGNVQQWSNVYQYNQQWKLQDAGDGYYYLVNRNSNKVADVAGVSTADGANVLQWSNWGGANQQWKFIQ